MNNLNFKFFFEHFIDTHTIFKKKEAANLIFYGSPHENTLSQSTVSKMQSDEYTFSTGSKPYKDYSQLTHSTKVNHIRALKLYRIPSSGPELCNYLDNLECTLTQELYYQLHGESDISTALVLLLENIMHCAVANQSSLSAPKLNTPQYLFNAELTTVLSKEDPSISLDSLKEALGWYIKMLCSYTKINTKGLADKAHMARTKFMKKTSAGMRSSKPLLFSDVQDICAAMNTSLGNILYCFEHKTLLENNPSLFLSLNNLDLPTNTEDSATKAELSMLTSDPNNDKLKRWSGKYFCFFPSTDSTEVSSRQKRYAGKLYSGGLYDDLFEIFTDDHIYCGILTISPAEEGMTSHCSASLRFMVNPELSFVKEYNGIVTFSDKKNAVYIELKSEVEAELTYIIFDDRFNADVHCALGQVLTISSRELHHRPCTERIIISDRKVLPNSPPYQIIKANLMMHDKYIRIDEFGYSEVLVDLKNSGDDSCVAIANKYTNLESLKSIGDVKISKCAYISEGFFDLTHFTPTQNIAFETALRQHSIAPWNAKTNSNTAIDLIEHMRNDTSASKV